jgi:hypothetical protein
MKREIKFRAWNKSKGQMVKDYAHFGKIGNIYENPELLKRK